MKSNIEEAKRNYTSIQKVLEENGGLGVSPLEVYTDIFRLGEGAIQDKGEAPILGAPKGNPICLYRESEGSPMRKRILYQDTFEEDLKYLQGKHFSVIGGLTYIGSRNLLSKASKMYAMIFDIDGVTESKIRNFISGVGVGAYPLPNYIVLSGHGLHYYYVFEDPIPLYDNVKREMSNVRRHLTMKLWNHNTSEIKEPQQQGINQGFRVIGSKTKIPGLEVRAFRMNTHPYALRQFDDYIDMDIVYKEQYSGKKQKLTFEEAKEKFPEWYKNKVLPYEKRMLRSPVRKMRVVKNKGWRNNRALYEWWLRKIKVGATSGKRYFCIMCLAIYAAKCAGKGKEIDGGVSFEELKKDAYSLIPLFNAIDLENPFTEDDVDKALRCYHREYKTFPIKDIAKLSGIAVVKNVKRKYVPQETHLKRIRRIQEEDDPQGSWRNKEGRPKGVKNGKHLKKMREIEEYVRKHPRSTVQQVAEVFKTTRPTEFMVKNYKRRHPESNVTEIAEALGVTRPTVYKYLKEMD